MEPITGVERISKQRWKLVCVNSFALIFSPEERILRNARFVISEKVHAFNAARAHVSWPIMSLARAN